MKPLRRMIIGLIAATLILLVGFGVATLLKTPETDKNWSEEFSKTTTIDIVDENKVVIHDVRDWTYEDKGIVSKTWKEVEVDPTTITNVWFVTEPFSSWKAVGHTFLSFEFANGTVLSFSIEARREIDEDYSALRGLFNEYELAYQWGTERDFITRRLLYLDHPVRRYPLKINAEMAEALFRGVIDQTNTLAEKPRFYNTLTENCTNALAHIVNHIAPKTLPYDISWNLTGYADIYLMKQSFISKVDDSIEKTRNMFDLTKHRSDILIQATNNPEDFSAFLNNLSTIKE